MSIEQQELQTKLSIDLTQVDSGLKKLQKEVTTFISLTEKNLTLLNKGTPLYNEMGNAHTKLNALQSKLNGLLTNEKITLGEVQQILTKELSTYAQIGQSVKDANKYTASGISLEKQKSLALAKSNTEVSKLQDKFASLNREAKQLQGHYKTIGSSSGLNKLKSQMSEIEKHQATINKLSSKSVDTFTTADFKKLDTAKAKFKSLKNQVADTKVELSDISVGGLAKGIVARSLGYTALFAAIAGVTQGVRAGVNYVLEYDTAVTKLAVLMDTTKVKATELENSFVNLSKRYGDSLASINQVGFELARAGIEMSKLVESTKSVVLLAKLTGDSIETSAGSIIAFLEVFGKDRLGRAVASVTELSASIATFANISRASTEDIKVFNNYALQTARTLGLSKEIYTAVGASLSNFGVNLSSAGTSFQRVQKIFTQGNDSLDIFFQNIGLNRQDLLTRFSKKGEESNEAFLEFIKTLEGVDDITFTNLTSGFDVLKL